MTWVEDAEASCGMSRLQHRVSESSSRNNGMKWISANSSLSLLQHFYIHILLQHQTESCRDLQVEDPQAAAMELPDDCRRN